MDSSEDTFPLKMAHVQTIYSWSEAVLELESRSYRAWYTLGMQIMGCLNVLPKLNECLQPKLKS